jgi:hypothetical protein
MRTRLGAKLSTSTKESGSSKFVEDSDILVGQLPLSFIPNATGRRLIHCRKPVSGRHFTVFCENMPVSDSLPLSAQLSAALVAFTIEADNAAEQRLPHKTTDFGALGGRLAEWLTSLAMWFNCIGPLAEAGELTVQQLEARARMATNLDGMRRWGYLTIDGIGRLPRQAGGAGRPHANAHSVLVLTERGIQADAVWRTLPEEIEQRWRDRFGTPRWNDCVERS